jgi:hypothetical protein
MKENPLIYQEAIWKNPPNLWKVVSIINLTGNTKFCVVAFVKSQSSCSPQHTIVIRVCNLYPYISTLYSLV